MAIIGKRPASDTPSPAPAPAKPAKPVAASNKPPGFIDRQRENIRNIMAELNKVTWPTREETRNLTIVVIGISVVLGVILASLDGILSVLYRSINP
jgi:preprotein translocase subunit SecE